MQTIASMLVTNETQRLQTGFSCMRRETIEQDPVNAELQAFTGLCHMMRNDLCFYSIPLNREKFLLQI